jgi:peptide-methionine (S)-S-oxide reductase
MRNRIFLFGVAAALSAAGLTVVQAASFPDPPKAVATTANKETVVLAGGCFWGMQGVFEHMKGVTNTVVGYSGGTKETAHYDMVAERNTGHAESIKVTWDPTKITYGELLKVYFSAAHDPTTLNRQEHDEGPEYRSAIFYTTDEQKQMAEAYIRDLNAAHVFRNPIVTQVGPLKAFYPAEEEHQHFLDHNPTQGYIAAVDIPKLNGFKAKYPEYYTKEIK